MQRRIPARLLSLSSLALPLLLGACADELTVGPGDFTKGEGGKADSSAEAIFLDFDFDGSLHTNVKFSPFRPNQPRDIVEDQLLYTIGQLNQHRSVGRIDKLEVTDIELTEDATGTTVSYHARMPVAWGKKNAVPSERRLVLPKDMSSSGVTKFSSDYGHSCVDFGAHDVTSGNMWYYFRPERGGCSIASEDLVEVDATVSISDINTTGKYPEYHKVWEDDTLKVVAIFGKYEDGATTASDAGIAAYNNFARRIDSLLRTSADYTTVPATLPTTPGVANPDLTFTAELGDGRRVEVVTLLVDNVRTAPFSFTTRYEALSSSADLIIYNGHAGLGANIRELARKGDWVKGQYAIVFMNGCDTYAYVDQALALAHAAVNSDDPEGTKYLDIVTNAMPSFFHSMPGASMALINGLLAVDSPKTYETIFRDIDSAEVVLVSGEQDNEFVPGGGGEPEAWDGMQESGTVDEAEEHRFETPVLAAGRYVFNLSGTNDADLYVRLGAAPTTTDFDCRPYRTGSNETCTVDITTPTAVHVMVRGWDDNSAYTLIGE